MPQQYAAYQSPPSQYRHRLYPGQKLICPGGLLHVNTMKKFCALIVFCLASFSVMAADEILIGQTADFSSVAGTQMKEFNAGALAYINRVNGTGGVKGKQIKLISLDDGYAADKAAQNAKDLIQNKKVSALFGIRGTDPTEAVMKVAEAAGVPVIAPVTGADSVRKSPVTFPVRASYRSEIEAMLRHIAFMPTKVALLVQNDKFGLPLATFIEERVAKEYRSITIIRKVTFDRKATDLKPQVTTILNDSPSAVIALCNPTSCEAFSREVLGQARQSQRPRPTIYQTSISDIYAQFKKLGPEVVQGNPYSQILPDPHRTLSPLTKEYLAAMSKANLPVTYRNFEGYVSAKVLVAALSKSSSNSPKVLIDTLEGMGSYDLGGLTVRYSSDEHQGSKYVDLVTLDGSGRLVH